MARLQEKQDVKHKQEMKDLHRSMGKKVRSRERMNQRGPRGKGKKRGGDDLS